MKKIMAALVAGIAVAAGTVATSTAANATDNSPCGGQWWHSYYRVNVQVCPDWSSTGSIPVYPFNSAYAENPLVGRIDPAGDDWYICGLRGNPLSSGGYRSGWWALTVADNGQAGWVNQIHFQGGGDDEPDANLRVCPLPAGSYSGAEALARLQG